MVELSYEIKQLFAFEFWGGRGRGEDKTRFVGVVVAVVVVAVETTLRFDVVSSDNSVVGFDCCVDSSPSLRPPFFAAKNIVVNFDGPMPNI